MNKIKLPYISIGKKKVGKGYPCFVVAEISANHHQKFEEAVSLIKAAAKAEVDAVKLQTYTPDTITINSRRKHFLVQGKNIPKIWKGKNLYELYQMAYTPWEWQPKLKKIAESLGLILFSTPFDETAVDFLESIDVPCYKIASYESLDVPLLRKVGSTKKPVIISQAFFSEPEVKFSLKTLREAGAEQIAVLHCVNQYSDKPDSSEMNLSMIRELRERFEVVSGFSDNNAGIEIPYIAALLGASIIEKHFILKRNSGGPDARFSIEPDEMRELVRRIKTAESAIGQVHYGVVGSKAKEIKRFVPSIFVVREIRKGEILTSENIQTKRPNAGLSPKFWDGVIGKRTKRDLTIGTPLSWDVIE